MMRGRVAYAGAIHEALSARTRRAACRRPRVSRRRGRLAGADRSRHHFRAGPQLRRARQELQFNEAGRAARLSQGTGHGASVIAASRAARPTSTFMHYECELAVVIGQAAQKRERDDAMRHVAGYTIANDYAIRDYLEN